MIVWTLLRCDEGCGNCGLGGGRSEHGGGVVLKRFFGLGNLDWGGKSE
jgi:hypothetical protein